MVQIIRGLASRDPLLMHLLRLLYFFMAAHSIQLTANHIPGVHNTIADSLSRNFMQVFRQLLIRNHDVARITQYLDDYLTLGPPGLEDCSQNLATITNCCHQLGVPLKQEKVEGPTTCLEFLGIILDTVKMELRLSDERIHNLKALLVHWDQRK